MAINVNVPANWKKYRAHVEVLRAAIECPAQVCSAFAAWHLCAQQMLLHSPAMLRQMTATLYHFVSNHSPLCEVLRYSNSSINMRTKPNFASSNSCENCKKFQGVVIKMQLITPDPSSQVTRTLAFRGVYHKPIQTAGLRDGLSTRSNGYEN